MAQPLVKEDMYRLIESLPEGATIEDLRYLLYVRSEIEAGRKSAREGVGATIDEIRRKYGLDAIE